MIIEATYSNEDQAYIVQLGEQVLNVPITFMGRLVSCMQVALYRQKCAVMEAIAQAKAEKVQKAKELIKQADHPDVLPFTQEKPPRKPGRPKGIKYSAPIEQRLKKAMLKKPKQPQKEEEAFHHTKFR